MTTFQSDTGFGSLDLAIRKLGRLSGNFWIRFLTPLDLVTDSAHSLDSAKMAGNQETKPVSRTLSPHFTQIRSLYSCADPKGGLRPGRCIQTHESGSSEVEDSNQ